MVVWKDVFGVNDYEASSDGRIRRKSTGRIISPRSNGKYLRVNIKQEKRRTLSVHRLVTLAFHGAPPTSKHDAAHNDGNSFHNHYKNLRWATRKENLEDRKKHGTMIDRRGANNTRARITAEAVMFIRSAYYSGEMTQPELAKKFSVGSKHISHICCGRRWSHV